MPRATLALLLTLPLAAADFSGASAFEFTRQAVAFGPRTSGSPAMARQQQWILTQLRASGCTVEVDAFTGQTPFGPVPMKNLLCTFKGTSGKAVVFSGHYDTKVFKEFRFVGANDAGSSTGVLLELARVLKGKPRKHDVTLVFFDGEEAFGEWSATDGIHGSRHLAARWAKENKLSRIQALINIDMIGDADLGILQEMHSDPGLRVLAWSVARDLGYSKQFLNFGGAIEDDHMPFVRQGVPALDLIDFDFGPNNSYWHTAQDTMDKISPRSLEVVGRVLLEMLRRLE
jgi:Zn-dependent M28 family amino/carboxypeptidase